MKKRRILIMIIMAVYAAMILAACSKSAKTDTAMPVSKNQSEKFDLDFAMDYGYDNGGTSKETGITGTSPITVGNINTQTMDKIIKRVNLEVETRDFDTLIDVIKEEIERLEGYDEKFDVNGRSYYRNNGLRNAYIIARIPKDRLNEFVTVVRENGNIVNENSSTENVTLKYVDIQSHKKSLEIEQERLWELLEKAEKMEDIITLQSRLSEIRYQIQMYETELRTIDNQVDYSIVTITVNEVERMSPVPEAKETVLDRIKNGFSDTMYDLSEGFKDFIVWFVVNLPYLVIWGVIIAVIILIARKIYKKRKVKRMRNVQVNAPRIDIAVGDGKPDNQG